MVAMTREDALKSISEYAARYGLKPSIDLDKGVLVILHGEYPIKIIVEPRDEGVYAVELRVGEGIDESIEELLDAEVDPRAELEDVVEVLVQVVDYAVRKLEEAGFRVRRQTREAILDVYDALESFLEEEE
ncbi:MAG: hypothetical protein GSR73_04715 [Desulfurococcales archaeon]|nr:hypothetical protein [Desulfurococcales archaeon]